MITPLSSENEWEFLVALSIAWEWMQRRPRVYQTSGAQMSLTEYLAEGQKPGRKFLALTDQRGMIGLVMVRILGKGVFDVHVIAQPGGLSRHVLTEHLAAIRDALFADGATVITTMVGTYRGHRHRGIQRVVEACGMTPTGVEQAEDGTVWREYAVRKDCQLPPAKAGGLPVGSEYHQFRAG